jgi:hypothetical protein
MYVYIYIHMYIHMYMCIYVFILARAQGGVGGAQGAMRDLEANAGRLAAADAAESVAGGGGRRGSAPL